MKKFTVYGIFLLLLPCKLWSQYSGGNGRGERFVIINTFQLDGVAVDLYGGGNGRGEKSTVANTNQVDGQSVKIYGGGNGRGEQLNGINTNELSGSIVSLYNGGNGRGEILIATNTNQLDGNVIAIYGGGNGRGEVLTEINSNQADGTMTLMYHGGNGRGETQAGVATLELDGAVASLYMGGNGRGESLFQLNTLAIPAQVSCFGANLENTQVKVYWTTSSELNSDYFTVEKPGNNNEWRPVGSVTAAGNSNSLLNYQFVDTEPAEGANYYRLKITGKDGKFIYSVPATVYYNKKPVTLINVFPNPALYQFTVTINSMEKIIGNVDITMYSAGGQMVLQKQGLTGNTHTIDVTKLPAGSYYLMVNIKGQVSKVQVIKQ